MCLKKILKKWTKKMEWYDISLVKLAVFFATLFLVTVWSGFRDLALSVAWYWYLVLMIVFAALPLKRILLD